MSAFSIQALEVQDVHSLALPDGICLLCECSQGRYGFVLDTGCAASLWYRGFVLAGECPDRVWPDGKKIEFPLQKASVGRILPLDGQERALRVDMKLRDNGAVLPLVMLARHAASLRGLLRRLAGSRPRITR